MFRDFPPSPWHLRGQLYVSGWWVSARRLQVTLAPEFELLTVAGRACVTAAFVDYQAGSVLTYGELLGAVSVRARASRRVGMSVTRMWVDDARSLRGGRALWGMPKEAGRIALEHDAGDVVFRGAAWDEEGRELARVSFQALVTLPRRPRLTLPLPALQVLQGQVHAVPASSPMRCSVRLLRSAAWSIPPDSPLAELGIRGARPFLSVQARDFEWLLDAALPVTTAR
jgi:hypothetical protein